MRNILKPVGAMILLAVLALAGFHLVENWRGKRAWERWKAQRVALGDCYDGSALAPPAVADGENFAKAPVVEAAVRGKGPFLGGFQLPNGPSTVASWRLGREEDMEAWRKAFNNPDLEAALAPCKPVLDAFAEATRRSGSRLKVRYEIDAMPGDSIPLMLGMRTVGKTLRLRALARLHGQHPEEALEDVLALLRFARQFQDEPHFTSHLLQVALVGHAMQPAWEGVSGRRWKETQLLTLQRELEGLDLLRSHRRTIWFERFVGVRAVESMAEASAWQRAEWNSVDSGSPDGQPSKAKVLLAWLLNPRGWVHRNLEAMDRFYVECWLPAVDPADHRVHAEAMQRADDRISELVRSRRYRLAVTILPALVGQTARVAERQNALDEAVVACALERHRLATGALPESLSGLVPAYLPRIPVDLLTGAPLQYQPLPGGAYRLTSPGWKPGKGPADAERANFNFAEGSWNWPPRWD